MLTALEKEVSGANADEESLLQQDLVNLRQIQDGIGKYRNTRYHCSGIPFTKTYYEVDWTTRLYHCLIDRLPIDVLLYDSFEYKQRFKAFQELFSACKESSFYFLCAVPDLILKKKGTSSSTSNAGSSMHVDESLDLIEIKHQTSIGRTAEYPHFYAQIFAELHFLATAFVLKELKHGQVPPKVTCNGLLLTKSGQMTLFMLTTTIGTIDTCRLVFESCNLIRPSLPVATVSGPDVCGAIKKLISL